MPGEIYNANPTVFAPSKSSKAAVPAVHSLWSDELWSSDDDERDEADVIDSDEIFGNSPTSSSSLTISSHRVLEKILSAPYLTRNTL